MQPPTTLSALAALAVLVGCMGSLDTATTASRGAEFFAAECSACHGADARGGVGPDLTTLSRRNGGTFPEIETLATIYGPAYHQSRGTVMPEFSERDLGPTVVVEVEPGVGTPIPATLVALSAYLQSIQR